MSYEIRLIRWTDASGSAGWSKRTEVEEEMHTHPCESVGFVLRDDEEGVLLYQSTDHQEGDREHVDNMMAIPRSCILEERTLRKKR